MSFTSAASSSVASAASTGPVEGSKHDEVEVIDTPKRGADVIAIEATDSEEEEYAVLKEGNNRHNLGGDNGSCCSSSTAHNHSLTADEGWDYYVALSLLQHEAEETAPIQSDGNVSSSSSSIPYSGNASSSASKQEGNHELSLNSKEYEWLDPTPDIHSLFMEYDRLFFWNTLKNNAVEVRWSKKMTLCAGLCVYQGRLGGCSVRLSEPLLKLRPRSDLVNTLLHEMIHAYLFVSENDRDRESHGPNFQKHMHRINEKAKTSITIYHSFHDEVDSYRKHVWRCDGPCRFRHPFYGYVKRAMNRAPAPNDFWWSRHQQECGGTFHKISEPEDYRSKGKGKKGQNSQISQKSQKRGESDIKSLLEGRKAKKTPKQETEDSKATSHTAKDSSHVVDLT
eukprot:gb/GECG01011090.1/.p1 GENE.gb/GECG01011090.1/~~gb/GECG01011090.1/.p1  ORF type:complete len:395 (+),score=55.27 gb/GECG01011090.1/:1-1185(+)